MHLMTGLAVSSLLSHGDMKIVEILSAISETGFIGIRIKNHIFVMTVEAQGEVLCAEIAVIFSGKIGAKELSVCGAVRLMAVCTGAFHNRTMLVFCPGD
jgi:hypothetical protein